MTSTYTLLIAIDRESGALWGGVEISDGIDALRADIIDNLSSAGIQESDEDGNPTPVTGMAMADRCTVYRVVLSDYMDEAPYLAPANALNLQRPLREGDEIHGVRIVSIEYPEATP
jgi:hypothetical protein